MNPLTIAVVVGIGYLLLRGSSTGASPFGNFFSTPVGATPTTGVSPTMSAAQLAALMAQNAAKQQSAPKVGGGAGSGSGGGTSRGAGGGGGVPVGSGLIGATGFSASQLAAMGYTPSDIANFSSGSVIPQETVLAQGLQLPTGISPGPSAYLAAPGTDVTAPSTTDVFGAPSADLTASYQDPFANFSANVPAAPIDTSTAFDTSTVPSDFGSFVDLSGGSDFGGGGVDFSSFDASAYA